MIKKVGLALAIMIPLASHAQSSVTMYGLISVGIQYTSNIGGHSAYNMFSGTQQNNRFGFRIREDLGGGNWAIADLENGFDVTSGKFQQGGRMFGRQAYVGLGNDQLGTLTVGRQYDTMWDYLGPMLSAANAYGSLFHVGDNDNTGGTFRYSNSLKYASPDFAGLKIEAMYAMSNEAGDFTQNSAINFGARYEHGPLSLAATYLDLKKPGLANAGGAVSDDYAGAPFIVFHASPLNSSVGVSSQVVYGAGAGYQIGRLQLDELVTDVRYRYLDNTSLHLDNFDTSFNYQFTPATYLGGAYIYTGGRYGGFAASPHWNYGVLSIDHFLSKRTDIYLTASVMISSGKDAPATMLPVGPSSSHHQNALLAGMRHVF
jgi:GBP family porin